MGFSARIIVPLVVLLVIALLVVLHVLHFSFAFGVG